MQTYNFPTFYRGDTFDGTEFTVIINDVAKDLTSTVITCEFRKNGKTGTLQKSITNGSGITVTDAVNGVFEIDSFLVDWDAGTYYYDIQFDDSGTIKTYISGKATVEQDTTQD